MAEYISNDIPAHVHRIKVVPKQIHIDGVELDQGKGIIRFSNIGRLVDSETNEPILDQYGCCTYERIQEFSKFDLNIADHITDTYEIVGLDGETKEISVYDCIEAFGIMFDLIYNGLVEAKKAAERGENEEETEELDTEEETEGDSEEETEETTDSE